MLSPIKNKYFALIIYEAINSNPNGDPDSDGMPRQDPETGHGIITDVAIKRRVRDHIEIVKNDENKYKIFVKSGKALNSKTDEAFKALNVDTSDKLKKAKKEDEDINKKLIKYMCDNYYDIRAFGGVMTGFAKQKLDGKITGPIQLGFAVSVDPIAPMDISITRCALTTEKDAEDKQNTMGSKYIVPYALYKQHCFISPLEAEKTGFSEDDLNLFWDALWHMADTSRAASRVQMGVRKIIIFKDDNKLGTIPTYALDEAVTIEKKSDVKVARKFADYEIKIDKTKLPKNIEIKVIE